MSEEQDDDGVDPGSAREAEVASPEPSRPPRSREYDVARASNGFPRFAKDFPRDPELDRLVVAYARGDYRTVRDGAPALAKKTEDDAVKRAAELLRARIEPDPAARVLFALAAALLAFLAIWWITHDGLEKDAPPAPKPKVEFVK